MSLYFERPNIQPQKRASVTPVSATDTTFRQAEHPRVKVLRWDDRLKSYDPESGRPPAPPRAPSLEERTGELSLQRRSKARSRTLGNFTTTSPQGTMPLFHTVPAAGFQALILCGPGVSLNTFTSNPEEHPKALVAIGNRPMVWYVLDWCYRMGVSSKLFSRGYLPSYQIGFCVGFREISITFSWWFTFVFCLLRWLHSSFSIGASLYVQ